MKNPFFLLLLLSVIATTSFPQSVKNIEVRTNGDKILVAYTIYGLKDYEDISQIEFYVSRDDGKTFEGRLKDISGNVSPNVRNGKYIMVWDVFKEIPFLDEELIFDIRLSIAEKKRKRAIMISLVGNTVTPLGLRVGQLGGISWYAEFRSSLMPFTTANYTYENETIIDYDKPGYYQFTGDKGYAAWSVVGGAPFQASHIVYFTVGGGYGVEDYLYEIDEYTYEPESKTGSSWAKDADYSNSGFELDAGIILKFNKFIISGGATSINFKTINWLAGIGVAF
jgi:hypothetical protein